RELVCRKAIPVPASKALVFSVRACEMIVPVVVVLPGWLTIDRSLIGGQPDEPADDPLTSCRRVRGCNRRLALVRVQGLEHRATRASISPVAGMDLIPAASSSVGLAAIQIANRVGAIPVALTRGGSKRQALLDAGAAQVIATEEQDLVKEVL